MTDPNIPYRVGHIMALLGQCPAEQLEALALGGSLRDEYSRFCQILADARRRWDQTGDGGWQTFREAAK